jgi:hypothetical protein
VSAARDDLLARVRGMHALWQRGVADLTVEQVNHVERAGVLPIAFTLIHCVHSEDVQGRDLLEAGPLLWDAFAPRLGVSGKLPWGRGTPVAVAERLRLGDMDAWRSYQTAVFERTERALAAADDALLDRPMFDGGRPDSLRGGFLGEYVREGPIHRRHALESWVFQHGSRHLGELEHARALVGLGGLS